MTMNDVPDGQKWSFWDTLRGLFWAGFVLSLVLVVATLLNVLFGFHLAFGSYGSSMPLPDDWEGVLIMGIVAAFFGGMALLIGAAGAFFRRRARS